MVTGPNGWLGESAEGYICSGWGVMATTMTRSGFAS